MSIRTTIRGIPPGDYVVAAWSEIEPGIWHDAEYMQRFEGRMTKIRILEGSTSSLNVEVIKSQ